MQLLCVYVCTVCVRGVSCLPAALPCCSPLALEARSLPPRSPQTVLIEPVGVRYTRQPQHTALHALHSSTLSSKKARLIPVSHLAHNARIQRLQRAPGKKQTLNALRASEMER